MKLTQTNSPNKIVMPLMSSLLLGRFVLTIIMGFGTMCDAFADDYPQSYIQDQLTQATQLVSVDAARIQEGEFVSVKYVGRPVFVYRRTPSDIKLIANAQEQIFADPFGNNLRAAIRREYGSSSSEVWTRLLLSSWPIAMKQRFRSIDQELAVIAGWSPVSGCMLSLIEIKNRTMPEAIFKDPCTGAQFDAAGKIFLEQPQMAFANRPTLFNVAIPPYRIEKDGKIIIGPNVGEPVPELNFSRDELYFNKEPTTLLLTAARYNDIGTVRAALKKGAKADYFKEGVGSPIDAACIGSSMEIIKLLVAHGAKKTPHTLKGATYVGRKELVEYLKLLPE